MSQKKLNVLLIMEQCNPEWSSVPLEGYNYYKEISQLVNVTLVTHERNEKALEKVFNTDSIIYIRESKLNKAYYKIIVNLTYKGKQNWPLYHTLNYPIYEEFNQLVFKTFKTPILRGDYDIVHVITPMMPRYPAKVVKVCQNTPFIIGPVNGGVPFPKGFQEVAKQEFAYFNFLRAIGRSLIPGYVETYKKADRVLAGSTYTLNLLKDLFSLPDRQIQLFYENGITKEFINYDNPKIPNSIIRLLFVGRLVPYKGCDMLIESINQLEPNLQEKIQLTIVGDGSEKINLEKQVKEKELGDRIQFTGWVKQQETLEYYKQSDIFCFPSIREFGGAVVLEAMACGLPCIVIDNGGIGEYVTEETGFKIEPRSKQYVIQELTRILKQLIEDNKLQQQMSAQSKERAKTFEWSNKARQIVEIYQETIAKKYNIINTK